MERERHASSPSASPCQMSNYESFDTLRASPRRPETRRPRSRERKRGPCRPVLSAGDYFWQSGPPVVPSGQPVPTQYFTPLSTAVRPDWSCGTLTRQVPGALFPEASVTV
jgi:hypothetical protein